LRAQVGEAIGSDVEAYKDDFKVWLNEFMSQIENHKMDNSERSKKPRKHGVGKHRKVRRHQSSSSSDDSTSSSEEEHHTAEVEGAQELRSIAKMLGVPPSFWSNLDKDNFDQVRDRLRDFCNSKNVVRNGDIPTTREARQYKAKREAQQELEGIATSNIIETKKRRCRDFIPLF
jgi:hypothetical protein